MTTTSQMPKAYTPADHEDRIRERWEASGAFHADPAPVLRGEKSPYCILIPPPNVTAALHLGHALNNTLQDILIRVHRMRGHETLWMPGTDHAGIATQAVVEKRLLAEEGKARTDFTREAFVARVQTWKDEYEARITDQLKRLGASCDWQRQRFTMDPVCARAVREAFFRLFREGLIYRGKRLVNWDPVLRTALADDEVEMKEVEGNFYYLRYPLVHPSTNPNDPMDCQEVTWNELAARGYPGAAEHPDEQNAWVTVATTRPETYLGDTAVAVHPRDPRAHALRGLMVQLPIVGRVIPIIEDEYVIRPDPASSDPKAKMATGFLKVTPAHDPNDYEIGRRHGLEMINVMAPDATISGDFGWHPEARGEDARIFLGRTREEARELVVREFEARNLLEEIRPHTHSVGHSDRSKVPIEYYLSDQWYVKVTDNRLVGSAQRALALDQRSTTTYLRGEDVARMGQDDSSAAGHRSKGDFAIRFHPDRYARTYEAWHDNLRDWCISRQLWWGHRIPVWSRDIADRDEGERLRTAIATLDRAKEDLAIRLEDEGTLRLSVSVRRDNPDLIGELESMGLVQDPDVLDTWFSSALWPLSTMGWPDPSQDPQFEGLLEAFNPTNVLSTGRDIITLWVSRMVMFNRFFRNETVPFFDVSIHPIIQDGFGQRMSKSLGNGVDPLDLIHTHGADALRMGLTQIATSTQDVRMPVDILCPHCNTSFEPTTVRTSQGYTVAAPEQTCPHCSKPMVSAYGAGSGQAAPTAEKPLARNTSSRFDEGRNFCNKLWNASRFAISMLADAPSTTDTPAVTIGDLSLVDRWMLARLDRAIEAMNEAIAGYHFARLTEVAYDLLWRDFCDWYLESIKPTVADDRGQQAVLRHTLDAILRLLHPIIPFVTEAIYERLRTIERPPVTGLDLGSPAHADLLATAPWPATRLPDSIHADADAFTRIQALVRAIRDVRSQQKVPPRRRIVLHLDDDTRRDIDRALPIVCTLAGIDEVAPIDPLPEGAVPFKHRERDQAVSGLADDLDADALRERLAREIQDLERSLAALEKRLANPGYTQKAPPHLVEETRTQHAKTRADLDEARRRLENLS